MQASQAQSPCQSFGANARPASWMHAGSDRSLSGPSSAPYQNDTEATKSSRVLLTSFVVNSKLRFSGIPSVRPA